MEKYTRLWRSFFLICMIALAVQQFIWADFRPVILPPAYPGWLVPRLVWTWVFSIALIAGCVAIFFGTKARLLSLVIAAVLLLLIIIFQIPGQPYPGHIGSWTSAFKELTFSGGFLLIAGSFPRESASSGFSRLLAKLIPLGKYFFAVTLIIFGVMHFVYPGFCASLVPNWMPWRYFWMYFGAVALILGGLGMIIIPIPGISEKSARQLRYLAAILVGIMLLLWLIMLHIPRAIAAPPSDNGNEWSSVFEAFGFSGIAFLVAGRGTKRPKLTLD